FTFEPGLFRTIIQQFMKGLVVVVPMLVSTLVVPILVMTALVVAILVMPTLVVATLVVSFLVDLSAQIIHALIQYSAVVSVEAAVGTAPLFRALDTALLLAQVFGFALGERAIVAAIVNPVGQLVFTTVDVVAAVPFAVVPSNAVPTSIVPTARSVGRGV